MTGNRTCIRGKCFHCDKPQLLCPRDGLVETSVAYWIPRHLKLYTYPPEYMPFSTPRMKRYLQTLLLFTPVFWVPIHTRGEHSIPISVHLSFTTCVLFNPQPQRTVTCVCMYVFAPDVYFAVQMNIYSLFSISISENPVKIHFVPILVSSPETGGRTFSD